jgi:hypothetical protein
MNSLDNLPPHLGGRNNGWRELSFASKFVEKFMVNAKVDSLIL